MTGTGIKRDLFQTLLCLLASMTKTQIFAVVAMREHMLMSDRAVFVLSLKEETH